MKKNLYLIILVSVCVWFFFVRGAFAERDVSDIHNHYESPSNEDTIVEFDCSPKDLNLTEIVRDLYAISEEYEASIICDFAEQDVFHEYLISPYSLKKLYGISDAPDISFNDYTKIVHISNNSKDSYHFRTINSELSIIIDSMNQLNQNDFSEELLFAVEFRAENPRSERLAAEKFSEKYAQYELWLGEGHQIEFDYSTQIQKDLRTVMFFMTVLLAMFLLFYLSSKRREITIYKLNGFSGTSIFRELFGTDVLIMIPAVIVESAILYAAFIGFMNERSKEFLKYYFSGIGIMMLALVFLGTVFSLMSRIFSINSLLKGQSINRFLSFGTYVLKFVVLIVMIPIVMNACENFIPVYKLYKYTEQNWSKLNSTVYFSGRTNTYADWAPVYLEMSDKTEDPQYLKEIEITDAFVHAGAQLFQDYLLEIGDPVHGKAVVIASDVNENYMRDEFPDCQEKSQIISLINERKEFLVLSQQYKDDQYGIVAALGRGQIPVIVLSSDVETINYSGQFDYKPVGIWHVFPNDAPMLDKVIFKGYYLPKMDDDQIHRILEEHGALDMYVSRSVRENVTWYRDARKTEAAKSAIRILLYGALMLLTMESFYISYQNSSFDKIAVKRLHGYSYLSVYVDYYFECLLLYIPLLIIVRQKVQLIILVLVFQLLQYSRNRIAENRRTISQLLKSGGEV